MKRNPSHDWSFAEPVPVPFVVRFHTGRFEVWVNGVLQHQGQDYSLDRRSAFLSLHFPLHVNDLIVLKNALWSKKDHRTCVRSQRWIPSLTTIDIGSWGGFFTGVNGWEAWDDYEAGRT